MKSLTLHEVNQIFVPEFCSKLRMSFDMNMLKIYAKYSTSKNKVMQVIKQISALVNHYNKRVTFGSTLQYIIYICIHIYVVSFYIFFDSTKLS